MLLLTALLLCVMVRRSPLLPPFIPAHFPAVWFGFPTSLLRHG